MNLRKNSQSNDHNEGEFVTREIGQPTKVLIKKLLASSSN